jgi:hypothetical protein
LDKKLLNLKKIWPDFAFFGKTQQNMFREGRRRPAFKK